MNLEFDTIIVPARIKGFNDVFLGQNAWWAVSIGKNKIPYLKYIAIYQKKPISAITHYAKIKSIEKYKNTDQFAIYFDGPPIEIKYIKYDSLSVAPQKQRYTTIDVLLKSKKLSDVLGL